MNPTAEAELIAHLATVADEEGMTEDERAYFFKVSSLLYDLKTLVDRLRPESAGSAIGREMIKGMAPGMTEDISALFVIVERDGPPRLDGPLTRAEGLLMMAAYLVTLALEVTP